MGATASSSPSQGAKCINPAKQGDGSHPGWPVPASEFPSCICTSQLKPWLFPTVTAGKRRGAAGFSTEEKSLVRGVSVPPNKRQRVLNAAYQVLDFISVSIIFFSETSSFTVSCSHFSLAFLSADFIMMIIYLFFNVSFSFQEATGMEVTFYIRKHLHHYKKRKETSALVCITHTHTHTHNKQHMEPGW